MVVVLKIIRLEYILNKKRDFLSTFFYEAILKLVRP